MGGEEEEEGGGGGGARTGGCSLLGGVSFLYLAHKKQRPPRALQWDYANDLMLVLGDRAVSYQRGTPVEELIILLWTCLSRFLSHKMWE